MPEDPEEKCCQTQPGISRRGFLSSVGVGAVAAVSVGAVPETPAQEIAAGGNSVTINLRINGSTRKVLVEPRWSLLYVVRDLLGLTGTKVGCERGECGACTVLIDGRTRYACMTLAVEAQGQEITTLEGLMDGEKLGSVQQAFAEEDAFQCGFCTPGQIMAVEGLLRQTPNPTLDQVRHGMSGNLCRCAAYQHIFRAAAKASELRGKGGAA
ncbi:MAG: carbon monoxide dehydrogenase, small subunit [Acidobacteria bacterium]|jgi:xanthine dehydrogenase YagT iron-sulfur-binding subunit|nr:carbon monoxide dehydrogenase, small subunit [Acidobacteriota bacterium]